MGGDSVQLVGSLAELKEVFAANTYVVVDHFASWCPPCKAIAPVYEQLAAKHSVPGQLAFIQVNTDDAQDIAAAHRIRAMPTFQFFKNGAQVGVNGQAQIQGADPRALGAAAEKLAGLAKQRQEEADAA